MRIRQIQLREVGPFDDVTIEFPEGADPNLADVYLLTGQNGTGKSTILYALASMVACGHPDLVTNTLLEARLRSLNATVVLQTEDERPVVAALYPHRKNNDLVEFFGGARPTRINPMSGAIQYFAKPSEHPAYPRQAGWSTLAKSADEHPVFDWAAFAYAGLRPVSDVQITAIQEPATSPLKNSLSFLQTADTALLANWIVSQNYRRLKAKEAGNLGEAEQLARSVRRIEESIADIIGDPGFGFVITAKDDDVRVRWRGATVRLGVLPDGLQSIVSWIADLLMRLARIPWKDNTPVEQRHFLLLLDEIDIHLHPAWQRRVLPFVQKLFPNAQIIASTHSPFVVGSLADGRIISLGLEGSSAKVVHVDEPQLGHSYSAVLRSIFGIESEFDVDTEHKLQQFHAARRRLLGGDESARAEVERIADELKQRSEELHGLMALELGQMRRQLAQRAAP
ncbi:MAG TPA: AAA family ATPase [Kofleriaceae bacterium]|nr:AAA family ATPase [Kofleriaceae bacterium]